MKEQHSSLEEREFVVASGASMHMTSKKDSNSSKTDTLTKSCSPTTVLTANGEVQTHEEAAVYVKVLDVFLTMKVLENTPAVLSLGKFATKRIFLRMDQWSKNISLKTGFGYYPGLSASSSSSSDQSTSRTPPRQESHSSSSSSPTEGEIQVREWEDETNSDISPVTVSTKVDDRTGQPVVWTRPIKIPKTNEEETTIER